MAELAELQGAIYDWLEETAPPGTPIDWEDGDDADRAITRISLRLVEDASSAPADVEPDTIPGGETVTQQIALILVINARGPEAGLLAKRVRASLYSSQRSGFNALWEYAGLGGITPIINLSALESAQISARYEFRVTLHTTLDHAFGADYAESVAVTVRESRLGVIIDGKMIEGE